MQLKCIIDGGLGAKRLVNFWKKRYFNAIGSHFAGVQRSTFERTRFFAFESQLKKLNCSNPPLSCNLSPKQVENLAFRC